jgi:hypothetical protein
MRNNLLVESSVVVKSPMHRWMMSSGVWLGLRGLGYMFIWDNLEVNVIHLKVSIQGGGKKSLRSMYEHFSHVESKASLVWIAK